MDPQCRETLGDVEMETSSHRDREIEYRPRQARVGANAAWLDGGASRKICEAQSRTAQDEVGIDHVLEGRHQAASSQNVPKTTPISRNLFRRGGGCDNPKE